MTRFLFLCFLFYLLTNSYAAANETILRFESDILVHSDASISVTETIKVRAEGKQIRRGIYRDFPTQYRGAFGSRVVVPFQPLEVLRDGKPEPWFTENLPNGIRVNFGDDSFLPVPLETTYTFRYHTARQLGFFSAHDELYWNVTGNGWAFPIEQAFARVTLPQAIESADLRIDYYTGPQGSRGQNAQAGVPQPGVVEFATTLPLRVREGLTVVVGFPKGIVLQPDPAQQLRSRMRDNWMMLILVAGVVVVLLFYLYHWRHNGMDPRPGFITPQFYPPEGFSAGALRYLYKGSYCDRCTAADLVQLGTLGCLSIKRDKLILRDKWVLEKKVPPTGDIPALRSLWGSLFHSMQRVELYQANHQRLYLAQKNHERELVHLIKPRYLIDNAKFTITGWSMSAALVIWAFVMSIQIPSLTTVVIAFVVTGILIALNLLFGALLRRPTKAGRKLLDHIEGLQLYMRNGRKSGLPQLNGIDRGEPSLDGEHFQSLLPFAMALDVEDAWTDRFVKAVGMAAAIKVMARAHWHRTPIGLSSLSGFSKNFSGSLCSSISSSSSPPGSSSGGGGGGSSGGGGGGGGGGGR